MREAASLRSYQDWLRHGIRQLRDAGIEDAALEARLLLMAAAGFSRTDLISAEPDDMPEAAAERFERMLCERLTRRPLQHVLGTTEFYGLDFVSDARALVPRPDSETVVEAALNLLPPDTSTLVADLGTGSGCLLAAILAKRSAARGIGVEASPAAASLALENLDRLGLASRGTVFEGSWTDWADWGQAGLVISNPPYIASAEIATLAPEVRDHDPSSALDGGADGLVAYREIIDLAARCMAPGAWLVFEIGYDQKETVSGLLEAADFTGIGSARDLGGNDRAVWAQKRES